jgi:hypothetical protein
MAEPLTIRRLIDRITSGDIRIPAFQRGYVWNADQVAFLLDSLYKGFPIGTIFLWKTDQRLKTEKNLGQFVLPEPKKDYPVNYVLDGQQRLTSLFSVFQTELKPTIKTDNEWIDIYYDLKSDENIQESCFFALRDSEADPTRHFPVKTMFDSVNYRKSTRDLTNAQVEQIDKVQEKFKEVFLPVQTLETEERSKVAIVFERINRAGTELDTYQLLTAWSWSEDFDLQDKFDELLKEIEPFGFSDLAEDKDLQLKCCSGVILGEATPNAIMQLRGDEVRKNFEQIKNGIKSSIDFLKKELSVQSLNSMPYPAMIVPLASFFATDKPSGHPYTDNQRKELIKWFWRSNFSRRYSSSVDSRHKHDLIELKNLKNDHSYRIKSINTEIDSSFFILNEFKITSVNTKIYVLMLAQSKPKSFISGANVDLEKVLKRVNRNEFHHIFPKKYLEKQGVPKAEINQFANFCFLSSADNQKIKDKPPQDYKKLIASTELKRVMEHALCPEDSLDMSYSDFIKKRVALLIKRAEELIS